MMQSAKTVSAKKVRFGLNAAAGSHVFVAGTFNQWSETENPLEEKPVDGRFNATLRVPPGAHQYKFIVNGTWMVDPDCKHWVHNEYGSLNSVLHV
jgi:1,4-alpha-glucan branching enzyme